MGANSIPAPKESAMPVAIVDIIPQTDSAETGQTSEPSIATNPTDWSQMIAGSFASTNPNNDLVATPYFVSTDGGTTWSSFGTLGTNDKSIAWASDGSVV